MAKELLTTEKEVTVQCSTSAVSGACSCLINPRTCPIHYTSAQDVYERCIPGYVRTRPHCGGDLDYVKDWTP